MKFLCTNCRAKYQIADEKVAGRTLRMTCRQCKQEIVIRSASRVSAAPAAAPLAPAMKRALAAGAHTVPPLPSDNEWHVGINGVPVGPMGREEVKRKIAAGAVGPDSLAWREGMDDWRAVRDVPALAPLCAPPRAPPRVSAVSALGDRSSTVTPSRVSLEPARVSLEPARASLEPAPAPPAPAGQAPAAQEWQPPQDTRPSSVYPPGAEASMAGVPTGPLGMSWGVMFALMCGFAFLMTATALFGAHFLSGDKEAKTAPAATAPAAPEPAVAAPDLQLELEEEQAEEDGIELEEQAIEASTEPEKRAQRTTTSKKTTAPTKKLTAAQKEMIARMGGGDTKAASIQTSSRSSSGSSATGQGLSAGQLSKVVRQGRSSLQRCYETALRQIGGSDETVRMDVEVTVSANGNVSKAHAGGKGLAGMKQCLERTVKAWRFPKSGGTTETRFPVVFQPGG
jgi:hypothetical protein